MSDSLQPHGLQHSRLSCPSLTPGACSNSCPLRWWCQPTISSSVVSFSSCLQFSQLQGLFQWVSSSHQVIKVLELQLQHQWFQWIFLYHWWFYLLAGQGTLKSLIQHDSSKASVLWHSAFFVVHLSHPSMATGKTIALTRRTFAAKVMSLIFNMLSRFVISFLPWSKCLLISLLQSPYAATLEPKKIKTIRSNH